MSSYNYGILRHHDGSVEITRILSVRELLTISVLIRDDPASSPSVAKVRCFGQLLVPLVVWVLEILCRFSLADVDGESPLLSDVLADFSIEPPLANRMPQIM